MRPLLELLRLLARSFVRAKLPGRRAEHASSGLLLRLFMVAAIAFQGWNAGRIVATTPERAARELGCVTLGLAALAIGAGAIVALPFFRAGQPVLRHSLLSTVPVNEAARTVAELASLYVLYGYAVAAAFSATGTGGVAYAFVVAVAFATLGNGALRLVRRWLSAASVGYARMVATGLLIVGYSVPLFKGLLAQTSVASTLDVFGRGLQRGALVDFGAPVLVLAVGALAIRRAERLGYDRVDLVPTAKVKTVDAAQLELGNIDALLLRREPGGRAQWIGLAVSVFFVGGALFLIARVLTGETEGERELVKMLPKAVQFYVAFLAVMTMLGVAQRSAARDATARSLLAPLPIAPRDLIGGRVRLLRRRTLIMLAPLAALCALPVSPSLRSSIVWHTAFIFGAGWLLAETAACVAFLADGIATPIRNKWSLANYLLLFPVPGIILAEHPWQGVLPLAFIWLTAREARRTSLGLVRWLDDDDEGPRTLANAPWRALVVFGAFAAAQGLFARALVLLPLERQPLTIALEAYVLGALLLVGLTAAGHGLRGLLSRPWRIERGVLFGVFSAAVAVGIGVLLRRWELLPPANEGVRGPIGIAALVVVAPIAEEIFFRGWLQSALIQRAPQSFGPIAFGALLFAVVHPVESFVPVFVLGIVTGHLRRTTGGIAAGCVAHAIHNAAVLLFSDLR